jgi:hypothetical protein
MLLLMLWHIYLLERHLYHSCLLWQMYQKYQLYQKSLMNLTYQKSLMSQTYQKYPLCHL